MDTFGQQPAFERLLGRVPSPRESERLLRLQKVLGLKDDDAMWAVGVILQDYDQALREELERLQQASRAQRADAARTHQLLKQLLERVPPLPETAPGRSAQRGLVAAGAAALLLVVSALCLAVGYTLGSGRTPPWAGQDAEPAARAAAAVLGAPTGWLVLLVLLPVSSYLAREAWRTATDATATVPAKLLAWGLVLLSAASAAALWAVLRTLL